MPVRLKDNGLDTLGLLGEGTGSLEGDDLALAQALVHVASVAIINERSATDRATVNHKFRTR